MPTPQPAAQPLTIRLVGFSFDYDYEIENGAEVSYKTDLLHRIPPQTETMDVLVTITYRVAGREEPVIEASCLTTYLLSGVQKTQDPENANSHLYVVSDELAQRMNTEAVAHARALLAQQLASTPFAHSHVALSTGFSKVSNKNE